MTHTSKKTSLTIFIILVFVLGYALYMYLGVDNMKYVPIFTALIFAIIPAILINNIWNRKPVKKN
jgi:cellulose synthase/poly-beta-1,6-N-acetylglucosamine synthase-like glycosyltransferase